jgi:four helix bundle protein
MKSYRDLMVWQKAMVLVEEVYRLTKVFPREEQFALTDQLRRAAVSVPANIAEDYSRQSTQDHIRFLAIARGSVYEMRTLLEIGNRLGYVKMADFESRDKLVSEIERMLNSLITKLRQKP